MLFLVSFSFPSLRLDSLFSSLPTQPHILTVLPPSYFVLFFLYFYSSVSCLLYTYWILADIPLAVTARLSSMPGYGVQLQLVAAHGGREFLYSRPGAPNGRPE